MGKTKVEILIIEDNPGDARLISLLLEECFGNICEVIQCEKLGDGISKLVAHKHDLVLLDLNLPDSNGLNTLKKCLEPGFNVPVIILTGLDDYKIGSEAIKMGAEDFLVKDNLNHQIIQKSIFYSIERFKIKNELKIKSDEVEQKRKQLDLILNKMFDAVLIIDDKGIIRYLNNSAVKLFGHDTADLLNTKFPSFDNSRGLSEIRIQNGNNSTGEMHISEIRWEGETMSIATIRDITKRKKSEELIKSSLREKEILLKEIHHRVKNNMQIISSMLWLQQRNIINEQDRMYFNDSRHRIKAMAIIYEKLYQSDNFAEINFFGFIEVLINELRASYNLGKNIEFDLNSGKVLIDLNIAIPLSQIVTELITNSIKYAFPGNRKGVIKIEFRENGHEYYLHIGDNGIGLPEGFQYPGTESIGLTLVDALIQQIHGNLDYKSENGTQYEITFVNGK